MSGLEVVAAVSAVVSAFHGGSELLAHIKKKRRRARSRNQAQQEFEEKQLQDSLETGETQIGLRYSADMRELGDFVRTGDAIARDRLLHIAVVMQAEIIKSLQLAVKHENAILNLKILHEASIMNRQETLVTLDELKQRILITLPVSRTLEGAPEGLRSKRASTTSVHTVQTANLTPVPDNYVPRAVSIPEDSKESKSGLARYFSMKRSNSQSSTCTPSRPAPPAGSAYLSPALNNLLQAQSGEQRAAIMRDIDEIISSYQGLHVGDKRDAWDSLHGSYEASYGGSKRDTLAILTGGDSYKRDTVGLNRDALQMLKNLPSMPEETGVEDNTEYPAFNHNVFDPHHEQHTFSQYVAPNPLPQLQTQASLQPRWSTTSGSSSVYSDATPPSLYRNSSTSSHESQSAHTPPLGFDLPSRADYQSRSDQSSQPEISHSNRSTMSTAPFLPFDENRKPHTPPPQRPLFATPQGTHTPPAQPVPIAPHANSQRTLSPPIAPFTAPQRIGTPPIAPFLMPLQIQNPPIAPFAAPQRPRTPIKDENGGLMAGRTRVHLVPGQDSSNSSSSSNGSERTATPSAFAAAAATMTSVGASAAVPSPVSPGLSHTNTSSSNGTSIRSNTIQGPITAQERMMDGRPCKENNYWGFCKGAWAVREDLKRGLGIQNRPDGLYNTRQIWECKNCRFCGECYTIPHPTRKNKKENIVDPNIYTSAVGIRYRWMFLAKSHVKRKTMDGLSSNKKRKGEEPDDCNYGCVICSVEGNVTGIYGNVETLMNHIFLEHARNLEADDKICAKSKCIVGRKASGDEEWDINIPSVESLM